MCWHRAACSGPPSRCSRSTSKRFGVQVDYVPLTDFAAWESAFKENTKLVFVESPSNPLAELVDIAALAHLCHGKGAMLAVDNCFCTPVLQQPLKLGRYRHPLGDQVHRRPGPLPWRCGCRAQRADEGNRRLPAYRRADAQPIQCLRFQGPETLRLRMQAHCASAQILARMAGTAAGRRAGVLRWPAEPSAARAGQAAAEGLRRGAEFRGGRREEGAWRFIDATRLISITANLGDSKTTITHPGSTTHGRLSAEDRATAGIRDSLIRVAVGLEDVDDLKADLACGLAAL